MKLGVNENTLWWGFAFILGIVVFVFVLKQQINNNEIDTNTCTTNGVLTRYYGSGRSMYYEFIYYANGKRYRNSSDRDITRFLKKCKKNKSVSAMENIDCLNRIFVVEYSCSDPYKSRILLDQPLPDTFHIVKPPVNK